LALDTRYLGTAGIELTHFHFFGNQPIPGPGDPQARRLYPDFGETALGGPGANSNYNSLQIQLTKRMSQGLTFIAGYTWAKELDNNEGEEGAYADNGAAEGQDDNHPGEEYAPGVDNVSQRFTWGGVYDLPFGPGKRFGAGTGRLLNTLIGGWEVSPNLEWQTGFYWTPLSGFDYANVTDANGAERPDRVCNGNLPGGQRTVARWFDTSCFTDANLQADYNAGIYRFGNASRTSVLGPVIFNLDLGMYKDFQLSERFKLQFRGEFFNALNNADFGNAVTGNPLSMNVTAGNYGQVVSAGIGRQIQFALKLTY